MFFLTLLRECAEAEDSTDRPNDKQKEDDELPHSPVVELCMFLANICSTFSHFSFI